MDRRTGRDVGVASAIGGALVVATLAVGQLFAGSGTTSVEGSAPSGRGAALVVAGGTDADRGAGRAEGDRARDTAAPAVRAGRASGGSGPSGATTGPVRSPDASSSSGRTRRGGSRPSTGGGSGSVTADADEDGTGGPSDGGAGSDGPSAGDGLAPTPAPAPGGGGGGRVTTASVRLDVTDLSVTGTDSETLRPGSEVRVRMATTRQSLSTGAGGDRRVTDEPSAAPAPGSGTGSPDATGVGAAASGVADGLPDQLDVRIRLDDAAVAALDATAPGARGPVALRALVDLVERDPSSDGTAPSTSGGDVDTGRYSARIRLRLTPADGARAVVADAPRTTDGVSNVVAVTTPIGERPAGDEPPAPTDDASTETVERRVPVPSDARPTTPGDGASVGIPIPAEDAGSPASGPSTADVAVVLHVPAAGEPIGGVTEDLTSPAPTTDDPAGSGGDSGSSSSDPAAGVPAAGADGDASDPSAADASDPSDGNASGPSGGTDGTTADGRPAVNPVGDAARLLDDLTGALGTLLTSPVD